MLRRSLLLAAVVTALYAPGASAAEYVSDEVIVRHASESGPVMRVVRVRHGTTVGETIAALRRRPDVLSATPNYIARASLVPNDPGRGRIAGGWQTVQWNFAGPFGINAPQAWDNVARAGRPGASGVVVAVLDTGVAYSDGGRFRRSPDLRGDRFIRGHDFVDDDPYPTDLNGHGTHVASTIAENVDNGVGVTGLAFGAKIMPVRVLDPKGYGDSAAIARGIRFAARRRVHIINLSFEFGKTVRAREIPGILDALRYARRKGVLVVGASGNESARIAYPARADDVVSVGATTEHGCAAEYSNQGATLDLVAPGGGPDAPLKRDPNCLPYRSGRNIVQMTFTSNVRTFGLPDTYHGTSMAAPHVTGAAALVIASGVLGERPSPVAIEARLKATARDLGIRGTDRHYGAGLIDAGAATAAPVA
ncbi:MAG TPA: S8 family serine peptidase [Solirubrobacteraceae bacterium]|nr:S8 family serine peptidase [Solirubrobacteraceae bacterium]